MQILPNRLDREARIKITGRAEALQGRYQGRLTDRGPLSLTDRNVLNALLRLSGASADAETIAAKAFCSLSSVYAAIKSLEAAGLLTIDRASRVLKTVTLIVPEQLVPSVAASGEC
jgi:DNA-binding MarR family transcriptional regulator